MGLRRNHRALATTEGPRKIDDRGHRWVQNGQVMTGRGQRRAKLLVKRLNRLRDEVKGI